MNTPDQQNHDSELVPAVEGSQPEWTPPELSKLPVAGTAAAATGNINDGFTFSS